MKADIEKTRAYYEALSEKDLCGCIYCRCYRAGIREACPEAADFLSSLGVDVEKPFETFPLEEQDGLVEFCGSQYLIFGTCPDGWTHKDGNLEFMKARSHPSTGIEEEHFILEMVSPIAVKRHFPR